MLNAPSLSNNQESVGSSLIHAAIQGEDALIKLIVNHSIPSDKHIIQAFYCAAAFQKISSMRILLKAYKKVLSVTISDKNIVSDVFVHAAIANLPAVMDFLREEHKEAILYYAKIDSLKWALNDHIDLVDRILSSFIQDIPQEILSNVLFNAVVDALQPEKIHRLYQLFRLENVPRQEFLNIISRIGNHPSLLSEIQISIKDIMKFFPEPIPLHPSERLSKIMGQLITNTSSSFLSSSSASGAFVLTATPRPVTYLADASRMQRPAAINAGDASFSAGKALKSKL